MRLNRWAEQGVLERVSAHQLRERELAERLAAASLDGTIIKLHSDAAGAPKKRGRQAIGRSCGGWKTKLHLLARDDRGALTLGLAARPGARRAGRAGPARTPRPAGGPALLRDRAYEDAATRGLAAAHGWDPVVCVDHGGGERGRRAGGRRARRGGGGGCTSAASWRATWRGGLRSGR